MRVYGICSPRADLPLLGLVCSVTVSPIRGPHFRVWSLYVFGTLNKTRLKSLYVFVTLSVTKNQYRPSMRFYGVGPLGPNPDSL
jgi:hypothetical protein